MRAKIQSKSNSWRDPRREGVGKMELKGQPDGLGARGKLHGEAAGVWEDLTTRRYDLKKNNPSNLQVKKASINSRKNKKLCKKKEKPVTLDSKANDNYLGAIMKKQNSDWSKIWAAATLRDWERKR